MSVSVLVGMQWGDEGKGKIIDVLTRDAEVVIRYQMQHKFFRSDFDRMTGVVAALITDHHFGVTSKHIDDLALAFIAPLHSD